MARRFAAASSQSPTAWTTGACPAWSQNDLGVGNLLTLPDDAILTNLRVVQLRNGLLPAQFLESRDFTVEMETGTGKTYVYLRTMFELNRRYGFTKFAVVVPSVAIKEGVNKSLEMMGEHLRSLYSGVPFEHFIYDSAKLGTGSQLYHQPTDSDYGDDRRRH